jgi:L-lactate dehydrogenase complex protein LldG
MDARNQIFSNIRKANVDRGHEMRSPLFKKGSRQELLQKWKGIEKHRASHMEELVKTFKRECESILGKVYVAETKEEVWQSLSFILKEAGIKKITKWESPVLERLEIDGLLESLGVQALFSEDRHPTNGLKRKDYLEIVNEAELGITGADYGLADTGTLVLRALSGQDRSASVLPPSHVAIIEAEHILPGSDDFLVKLQLEMAENGTLDSCLTLITGPSKTADIELTLILGVHGPKDLHVIILKTRT